MMLVETAAITWYGTDVSAPIRRAGASYARAAGVAHNVINDNSYEFRFVEIELI